jgi:hypothetical protein
MFHSSWKPKFYAVEYDYFLNKTIEAADVALD